MIGGQLQLVDLTSDETSFLNALLASGRVFCPPGSRVRGEVVEQVVTRSGPLGKSFAGFRRLEILSAHIIGKVDLSDCTTFPVLFDGCLFSAPYESFDMSRSEVKDLRLAHCAFAGTLRGDNTRISGNLWLMDCIVEGLVNLMLARIDGSLIATECLIEGMNDAGISFALDGVRVGGLFQISGSALGGGISVRESHLGSQSVLKESRLGLGDPSKGTLYLQKATVESEMTIGPNVSLNRVMAEAIRSKSDVVIRRIRPIQRRVELNFDRAEVRGGLQLFDVAGYDRLLLRSASLGSLKVSRSRLFARGVDPNGNILVGVTSEESRYAISADGIQIAADVQLGPDLHVLGEIRLIGGSIGGQLQYERGDMRGAVVMNLEGLRLDSAVFLDELGPRSIVHLAAARVGGIFIDPKNIPQISLLRTEYGFINDEDGRAPTIAVACEILAKDPMTHSTVPYRRLARWYSQELGDDRASRAILIAGEKRAAQGRSRAIRVVDTLWRWTVGYGYSPSRAIWPFVVLVALASVVFSFISGYGYPANWALAPGVLPVGSEQPFFNPVLYALSATVPFLPDFLSPWSPSSPPMQVLTLVCQVLGWLLITALVAGVANRLRRRG